MVVWQLFQFLLFWRQFHISVMLLTNLYHRNLQGVYLRQKKVKGLNCKVFQFKQSTIGACECVISRDELHSSGDMEIKSAVAGATEPPSAPPMTTTSVHHFDDSNDSANSFSITIIENMKEDYGLFVWPCSVILAEYVWQQRLRFSGVPVLELGAGTSLPGLVAAKVGSDVTLTDDASGVEVLTNMARVCELNNIKCKVMGLTWGVWDASIFSFQPNIILGADVLYDTSAFNNLFATVKFLLQNSPGSVFITSYHNRSGHHLIEFLMVKWGLKCVKLLDGFSILPSSKTSGLSGNIQVAEIVLEG